jgi:hypothetical protein
VFRSTHQKFDGLTVAPLAKSVARDVVVANHYSHKWNNGSFGLRNFGVFLGDELLGVAVYGYAMNPKSWRSITKVDPNLCLELNRLWVDDRLGSNTETWFMAQCMFSLKSEGFRLIQSFADGRLGVGTIYQAANFGFYGVSRTTFHKQVDTEETFHDTQFSDTRGATGMVSRNVLHAQGKLRTIQVNTYRYLFPLDKGARRSILIRELPYPKERFGVIPLNDYVPPLPQIARSAALAFALGDEHSERILRDYLAKLTTDPDDAIEVQMGNRWVVEILKRKRILETTLF